MQRSRSRKLERMARQARTTRATQGGTLLRRAPTAAAIVAAIPIPRLYAADTPAAAPADTGGLQEVVVTAEKRTENLQDVPVSITALSTEKLEQLNVQNFNDYVKFL